MCLGIGLFLLASCRPVVWVPTTSQTPTPDAAAPTAVTAPSVTYAGSASAATANALTEASAAAVPSAPGSAKLSQRTRDSLQRITDTMTVSSDELTRTVAGVFGGAPIESDSLQSAAETPVWDMDVQSYEAHERVVYYVQLFSADAGSRFSSRLSRGTRYDPMIRSKLRASGLPEDLTYLALIESGYDPHAYSRAAAVGMWQFMTATARDVGLRVDWWVDERRDPVRSTEAAIRFLSELQKQFGSLYLAAAAYNGGPGRVARGLTRFASEMEGTNGEDRFFALAEQDYLRAETKNYVPQLIGAALVAKTPIRYGLVVDTVAQLAYDSVSVAPGTSLAAVATASGSSVVELKDLNPSILRGIAPPDASVWIYVPVGRGPETEAQLSSMSSGERAGFTTTKVKGTTTTVAALAKSEGLTLKQLRWFNPTLRSTSKGKLVSGQTVRIPERDVLAYARELPDPSIERYGGASTATLTSNGYHVVRRGETLGGLAKRYHTTVARLQSTNGMKGTRLIAGQTLRVSAVSSKSVASKAVAKKSVAASKSSSQKRVVKKAVAKKPVKKPTRNR